MQIRLDTSQFDRLVRRTLDRLNDGTELATLIGEEYTSAIDERFKQEIDPDGSPWAALPPAYVRYKQRKGHISKILQMRGNMRARVAYIPYRDRVAIGTDVPYARRQNAKRPFLYREDGSIGAGDERKIQGVAESYLQDLVDRT